jgi:hypothetical protein
LDPVKKAVDPTSTATREKQESLDQNAILDFWKRIPSLAANKPIAFLLITGNLRTEPCSISDYPPPTDEKTTASRQKTASTKSTKTRTRRTSGTTRLPCSRRYFGDSPVRDIYIVAGNNDIASEVAADDALDYFNQFIDDIQKGIDEAKKSVQLHNLTRCYANGAATSSCFADIAERLTA